MFRLLAAALAATTLATPALAAPETTILDAVRLAGAHDLEVALAAEQARQAELAEQVARADRLPSVAVAGRGVYRELSVPQAWQSALGSDPALQAALVAGGMAPGANLEVGVVARQTVFDGFATQARVEAAAERAQAARLGLTGRRLAAQSAAAEAYLDVLAAGRRLASARADLERAEGLLKVARDRQKRGLAARLEVVRAEARLAASEGAIATLQAQQEAAWDVLTRLSGDRLARGPLAEAPEPAPLAVDWGEGLAPRLAALPALQALAAQEAAARAETTAAERANWPRLALEGRYDRLATQDLGALSGGARVEWPLFDGFRAQAQAELAKSQLRQAELSRRLAAQHHLREARAAYQRWLEARAGRESAESHTRAAQEAFRTATRRYETGMGIQAEALEAAAELSAAENRLIDARYAAFKAHVRVAAALGLSIEDWLAGR